MVLKKCKLLDLDDIFAYRTPRTVRIRDRKLGIARILLLVGLFIYVVVYEVILQKGYLAKEAPVGFFARVSVRNDKWTNQNPGVLGLPYCCHTDRCQGTAFQAARGRLPCMHLGDYDAIVPPSEDNAAFITTRVTITKYHPRLSDCVANVQVPGLACSPWQVMSGNTSTSMQTGDVAHYVAGTENHTVLIRHAIYGKENDLALESVADMPKARLAGANGDYVKNFCDLQNTGDMGIQCDDDGNEASRRRPGDVLTMKDIFDAAEMVQTNLDVFNAGGAVDSLYLDKLSPFTSDTLRYDGLVMLIVVEYKGTGFDANTVKYTYHVKYVPSVEYKYEEVKDYSYRDPVTNKVMVQREVWNRHGVRVIVVYAGWMGKFSFVELLKTLVTGLALLALAGTITDYIVMRLLPNAEIYRRYKNVRTIDFSDLKPGTRELEDDKKLTWGGRHLTDEVFVYGELSDDEKEISDQTRGDATSEKDKPAPATTPDAAAKPYSVNSRPQGRGVEDGGGSPPRGHSPRHHAGVPPATGYNPHPLREDYPPVRPNVTHHNGRDYRSRV